MLYSISLRVICHLLTRSEGKKEMIIQMKSVQISRKGKQQGKPNQKGGKY